LQRAAAEAPAAHGIIVALAGPWRELAAAGPLPPTADLSAPPSLPEHVRRNAPHHLSIDQLVAPDALPPPGYVQSAAREVDRGLGELTDWLTERGKLELRKAAAR
jgi:hypothetical protein